MCMKVLIACEESQTICKEFRILGFECFSCDLLECSGGFPQWHLKDDVLKVINNDNWDLIIGHPPCTFLTVTGNKWFYHPKDKHLPTNSRRPHPRFPNRNEKRKEAIKFFIDLFSVKCKHIALENPVGFLSTSFRKPDQYIHPYFFGDCHSKKTGLWLKNLPILKSTKIVKPEFYIYKDGRKDPIWHYETMKLEPEERKKVRSKTFPGIARAIASQWGEYITKTNRKYYIQGVLF